MPFCIIQQGSVVASESEVGAGEYIGESALQAGDGKAAKVSALAKTAGLAFTIDPVSFRKVFGDYDRLKRKNEEQKALVRCSWFGRDFTLSWFNSLEYLSLHS